jgi:glutamyl/glutaminyl-tRNA synthetase
MRGQDPGLAVLLEWKPAFCPRLRAGGEGGRVGGCGFDSGHALVLAGPSPESQAAIQTPTMSQVRVRFAPSPTGFFHIGSARTALFNWLYARHTGGVFILRVEDTDQSRNSEEFLNLIYDSLRWLGLDWDEGPGAGGAFGPYRQSERAPIYREYLERLKASGRTYEKDGALFFRISGEPQVIEDAIRGRVERTEEKDFVIVRSDGNPVFHLVNVVDDIAMQVTHVIRGEDHLSNTSKHTELFKAFGAPLPDLRPYPAHPEAERPRQDVQARPGRPHRGVPEARVSARGARQLPLPARLVAEGRPGEASPGRDRAPLRPARRQPEQRALRREEARAHEHGVPARDGARKCFAFARDFLNSRNFFAGGQPDESYLRDVILLCQPKVRAIEDLPGFIGYFFSEDYPVDPAARLKVLSKGDPKARLGELLAALPGADFSGDAALEALVQQLAAQHAAGTGDYIHPARLALSGTAVGPSFYGLLRVLGRERVARRIERFLATA